MDNKTYQKLYREAQRKTYRSTQTNESKYGSLYALDRRAEINCIK